MIYGTMFGAQESLHLATTTPFTSKLFKPTRHIDGSGNLIKCVLKIKVFGWLLLCDTLNTLNMVNQRHYNIGGDMDCLLYGLHIEEMIEHMTFDNQFSKSS